MEPVKADKGDGAMMGSLVLADIELAGQYAECRKGKQGLIDAVRKQQK